MKKHTWMGTLAASITLALSAHAAAQTTDVTIAAGPAGGTLEVVAAASVEILSKKVPNARFGIVPGGTASNVAVLGTGKVQMSMVTADTALAGWNGTAPFKKSYQDTRGMIALYPNTLQVWTSANSGVKDMPDLAGKRFTFGQPGSGPFQAGQEMLKVYGVNGAQPVPMAWGAAVDALRDNNIDAVLWTTSFPAPAIVDASTSRDIRLLQLNQGKLEAFKKKAAGWVDVNIPAGTYKNQAVDVKTVGTVIYFAVDKSLPDEAVYQMTKALYENRSDLAQTHALLKYIDKDTAAKGMGVPLHPGAARYFKEAGVSLQ